MLFFHLSLRSPPFFYPSESGLSFFRVVVGVAHTRTPPRFIQSIIQGTNGRKREKGQEIITLLPDFHSGYIFMVALPFAEE